MTPDDMKYGSVPWDAPVNKTPIADVRKAVEAAREYGIPIDSPEAWRQVPLPAEPPGLWRRLWMRIWPEDGNRPRVVFERDYGRNPLMFMLSLGRYPGLACYVLGRGVRLFVGHGLDCDCDDCIPF